MKKTVRLLGIIALLAVIMFSAIACKRGAEATASARLDNLLVEYDKLLDELQRELQRAIAGDAVATARLGSLMARVETFAEEFEKYLGAGITAAQAQKIEDYTARLMNMFGIQPNDY